MVSEKFASHTMSEHGKELSEKIRELASELDTVLDSTKSSREQSLAKTKLEECVMWANKAIALHG